ncbi:MAG: hypothetical protein ABIN80_23165 [Dyadobacter sp.]|uniref:hypothetical protein n=1 Tax=Dyadobacter sp. TaxID=1914288 RepID=UPI0032647A4B
MMFFQPAEAGVVPGSLQGASEDFSYFAKEVPGLYIFLCVTPDGEDPANAAPNHHPKFLVDEKALVVCTRQLRLWPLTFNEQIAQLTADNI